MSEMDVVIAQVAKITGLPVVPAPKGGMRIIPLREFPPHLQHAWCFYRIKTETITCRVGYEHLLPHELTHHLQARAGWDFNDPDIRMHAEAIAWSVQMLLGR